jgi:hypothetical protein
MPAPGQAVTAGGHPLHGVWELVSLEDHQPDGKRKRISGSSNRVFGAAVTPEDMQARDQRR